MKSSITTLLLLSLLAVAVFGFFMIEGENMHMFCAAALGGKSPCPSDGILALVNYHLNILKNFSTATPNIGSILIMVLSVIVDFLSTIVGVTVLGTAAALVVLVLFRLKSSTLRTSPVLSELRTWLSFHETSPTLIRRA